MTNYYKFLRLPYNASNADIQQRLKLAAQSGKVPVEILREMRDTLFDPARRNAYNIALRRADPEFFQAPTAAAQPRATQTQNTSAAARQAVPHQTAPRGNTQSRQTQANRAAPKQTARAAKPKLPVSPELLNPRNILLGFCALGIITWLLPWANIQLRNFTGLGLNYRLLAWVTAVLFAAAATKVWTDDKQKKPAAYLELMCAAAFVLAVDLQFILRLKPFLQRSLGMPAELIKFDFGIWAQIVVALLMLGYTFWQKRRR